MAEPELQEAPRGADFLTAQAAQATAEDETRVARSFEELAAEKAHPDLPEGEYVNPFLMNPANRFRAAEIAASGLHHENVGALLASADDVLEWAARSD